MNPAHRAREAPAIVNQTIELVAVDQLRPHPDNPNQGDLEAVGESIAVNGFYGTVVAQRSTGHILAGNHRWRAARAAGLTELPVAWVDVDDAAAVRILVADNRTTRLGSDDPVALAGLLSGLDDLAGTGYGPSDLEELLASLSPRRSARIPTTSPTFRSSRWPSGATCGCWARTG